MDGKEKDSKFNKNENEDKSINKGDNEESEESEESIEEIKFEKYKIYNYLIDFKKRFSKNNSEIWWPVNLSYGGKSYYPTNKLDSLSNPNTNIIHYYC